MSEPEDITGELTPLFLATLQRAARTYGWEGDYEEVVRFVSWCYRQNGGDLPDMTPFDDGPSDEAR